MSFILLCVYLAGKEELGYTDCAVETYIRLGFTVVITNLQGPVQIIPPPRNLRFPYLSFRQTPIVLSL